MSLLAFKLYTPEIILILIAGILLFGRRLPEFGRRMGMGIVAIKSMDRDDPRLWLFGAALVLALLWLLGLLLVVLSS